MIHLGVCGAFRSDWTARARNAPCWAGVVAVCLEWEGGTEPGLLGDERTYGWEVGGSCGKLFTDVMGQR